jgi:hypothetical protein
MIRSRAWERGWARAVLVAMMFATKFVVVFPVNTPKLPPVLYFLIKTILKNAVGCPIFWNPLYLILTLMKLAHLGALGYTLINVCFPRFQPP